MGRLHLLLSCFFSSSLLSYITALFFIIQQYTKAENDHSVLFHLELQREVDHLLLRKRADLRSGKKEEKKSKGRGKEELRKRKRIRNNATQRGGMRERVRRVYECVCENGVIE